jgi:hypothetical protein
LKVGHDPQYFWQISRFVTLSSTVSPGFFIKRYSIGKLHKPMPVGVADARGRKRVKKSMDCARGSQKKQACGFSIVFFREANPIYLETACD